MKLQELLRPGIHNIGAARSHKAIMAEAADRIDALERENAALRFQLLAASNYIDALGGVSNSYRAAIDAAMEQR